MLNWSRVWRRRTDVTKQPRRRKHEQQMLCARRAPETFPEEGALRGGSLRWAWTQTARGRTGPTPGPRFPLLRPPSPVTPPTRTPMGFGMLTSVSECGALTYPHLESLGLVQTVRCSEDVVLAQDGAAAKPLILFVDEQGLWGARRSPPPEVGTDLWAPLPIGNARPRAAPAWPAHLPAARPLLFLCVPRGVVPARARRPHRGAHGRAAAPPQVLPRCAVETAALGGSFPQSSQMVHPTDVCRGPASGT